MSHLNHIMQYREFLTQLGVTCPLKQTEFCQEAYIRAVMVNHCKYHDAFEIGEGEESALWEQLDKWNSVAPIPAKLILESARLRLRRIRASIMTLGVAPGNAEFDIVGEVQREVEGQAVAEKVNVTDNEVFLALVQYLAQEMRAGHE